jgi:diguanylate cyclase (GGDEF)-like protein
MDFLGVSIIETSFHLAYWDQLTELPTRRALDEALQQLGFEYAVAMVDVDNFKKFNDTYGHEVGDQVLRMVGSKLGRLSGVGRPFRYGGEEFAILFPSPKKARNEQAPSEPRRHLSVTVSIGVAERNHRCSTPEQVVQAADKALYRAKMLGRNLVRT